MLTERCSAFVSVFPWVSLFLSSMKGCVAFSSLAGPAAVEADVCVDSTLQRASMEQRKWVCVQLEEMSIGTARRRPAEESHPSQPGCKQAPIWGTPIFVVLPLSLPTSVRLAFERNEALRQTTVDEMRPRAPEGDLPPSRAPLTPDVTASSDEIAPSFRPEAKAHPACYHAQEVP
jgi:hypothetical protein